ncbi:hypothetical protein JHQ55_08490, partial [Moraxella catarrhalis]|nr:hypothetical protein [Moraxella catarrhalis]
GLREKRDAKTDDKRYIRTTARGHASTAVGAMSQATGHFSNAFGTRAVATGYYSLAVGLTAKANRESSIAIGSNSESNRLGAIAIGTNTQANIQDSIALGSGSNVNVNDNANANAYIPTKNGELSTNRGQAYQAATGNTGPLSIGSQNLRRRIINVGAGVNNTDAVNVAQLKAVAKWAERPITFQGDDSSPGVKKELGEILTIKGG